jgi:hypothetical protein
MSKAGRGKVSVPTHGRSSPRVLQSRVHSMRDLRIAFRRIQQLADPQARGYELETLVCELARLTFGTAVSSYVISHPDGSKSQIDGFFSDRADRYRVECKWRSSKADRNDVLAFADRLDVPGVGGLFIAMAGFEESAIAKAHDLRGAKIILLMDGMELQAVLEARIDFAEIVQRKRLHFDQRSEPYCRVAVSEPTRPQVA